VTPELRSADLAAVREQLGREPDTPFSVVCRCTGGHPLVIRNSPLDVAGEPFPTTFWLTCPASVRAVSRLESEGWIGRLNERFDTDRDFATAMTQTHLRYAEDRAAAYPKSRAWGGVGGTKVGIKCLHAHYAYHLFGGEDPVGAWVAGEVDPVHGEDRSARIAAIDQGTNSIRLIVAEPPRDEEDDEMGELARDMVITRLGEGVDRTGELDSVALERTVSVLATYCRRARALGAARIKVTATSAVRDAANRDEFAQEVARLAGSTLEIISGEREAGLSFLGATHGLSADVAAPPYLVLDIGGGSTEFVAGTSPGTERAVSTQMGSVRLTERLVRSDPPSRDDLAELERAVEEVIDSVEATLPVARDARTLVSVAGTATTLQAIALGLDRYDPDAIHRTWLSLDTAREVLRDLVRMTDQERADIPVMAPGRGDVIIAGAVILTSVMRRMGFDRTLVSETDILDGLAFESLGIG
jgi:exopolyphosphatase / guanosine-5'-triphosphate,3'-diphosphate pyrophosphatase